MDKFENFLMMLGGIALMVLFAFPQVIVGFYAIISIVGVLAYIIDKKTKE